MRNENFKKTKNESFLVIDRFSVFVFNSYKVVESRSIFRAS